MYSWLSWFLLKRLLKVGIYIFYIHRALLLESRRDPFYLFAFCLANPMEVGGGKPTVQTETHTFGEDVRFDCNTSQNGNQALWQRTTSNVYQLLYAGVSPVINRKATNINVSPVKYSLFLNSITIEDEGLYDCVQFTKILASYRLNLLGKFYYLPTIKLPI